MRQEENIVTNKIYVYTFLYLPMVTFTDVLLFSYRFELLSGAFYFISNGFFYYFIRQIC